MERLFKELNFSALKPAWISGKEFLQTLILQLCSRINLINEYPIRLRYPFAHIVTNWIFEGIWAILEYKRSMISSSLRGRLTYSVVIPEGIKWFTGSFKACSDPLKSRRTFFNFCWSASMNIWGSSEAVTSSSLARFWELTWSLGWTHRPK